MRFAEIFKTELFSKYGQKAGCYINEIYDIISNKSRNKFSKLLLGYGFRIQKSAFEAVITKNKLMKLITEIPRYINENEDSVRLYQIKGKCNVTSWGKNENYNVDEVIIL